MMPVLSGTVAEHAAPGPTSIEHTNIQGPREAPSMRLLSSASRDCARLLAEVGTGPGTAWHGRPQAEAE
jgi:hypothetical protein